MVYYTLSVLGKKSLSFRYRNVLIMQRQEPTMQGAKDKVAEWLADPPDE